MTFLRIPIRLLRAMHAALPRLRAAEALRAIRLVAAGTGNLEKGSAEAYLAELERRAAGEELPHVDRQTRLGNARAVGIRVERVGHA